ncbi:hypothetical protein IAR55_003501 [Kwoniella newhampshirensis]|uniref:UBC core domain-containing protein n=1 Tax=Kwoniella newhampshirensis TaxID=1651941 RepID=A0AAW0YMK8_9TREE
MASTSRPKVNLRSTAVKRIMQEASELAEADADEDGFVAAPLESDIFEWHCTMRGVHDSEYESGLYHLRILLPPSYPMSAPDIMLMTPNGRFELGKKICIDGLTSFHAGSWQPAWGVRTAVVGLRSFWMQTGEALSAIGALDYSKEERKRLARLSRDWKCPICGIKNEEILPVHPSKSTEIPSSERGESSGQSAEMVKGDEEVKKVGDEEQIEEAQGGDVSQGMLQIPATDREDGHISLDPAPSEIPTLVPPMTSLDLSSSSPSSSSISPPSLPIDNIPPPLDPPLQPNTQRTDPETRPTPTPTRTFSSRSIFRSPPVTPPPIETQAFSSRRVVPIWLDAIIIAAISVLILLISRKFQ